MSDPMTPGHAGDEVELHSVLAILKRQRRVIAATAFLMALGAVLFLSFSTPRYSATALLLVDPQAGDLLEETKAAPAGSGTDNTRVDTEVEILRSDAVALAVIERLGLAADPEFLARPGLLEQLAEFAGAAIAAGPGPGADPTMGLRDRLMDRITIRRRGLTYLISVSAQSRDPERAAELANALAETYIAAQLDAQIAAALAGSDVLAGRIAQARARLAELERQTDMFVLVNMQDDMRAGDGLAGQMRSVQTRADERRDLIRNARAHAASGDWALLAGLLDDVQLAVLAAERADLAPKSQGEMSIAFELQRLDAALAAKADRQLDAMSREVRELDRKAADLREEIRGELPVSSLSPEQLAELYGLHQEAAVARDQYQQLLSRMRELETRASVEIASSRVVSPAIAPTEPSFPDPLFVSLLAMAVAGGLGLSLAFANEYLVGGVTSEPQLAELLRAQATGEIPAISIASTGNLTPADRIIDAPLSAYSEALRKLRASIDQTLRSGGAGTRGAERGAVILVTSALPGEGKSTAALALARTYAAAGRKTLLIDGDLRNPSIHRQLGFQPETGFQDYLRDPSRPEDVRAFYARDPSSSLAMILGSGPSFDATDQLVCSETFLNILAQARDVYDVTVIDSPPVLPVVDPRYVASYADLAVMVVKWGATGQGDLRMAAQHLRKSLKADAQLLPVLSHSRSAQAQASYGDYYSDNRRYSAAT